MFPPKYFICLITFCLWDCDEARRCIWHMGQSIIKNLASLLGDHLSEFLSRFYNMNHCVGEAAFKELWRILMRDFPMTAKYMEKHFGGDNMKRWALPWQVLPNNPELSYVNLSICIV